MSLEFLILGGYGLFVWAAYIFTFIFFFTLYAKTNKELKDQEKMFVSEFRQQPVTKVVNLKNKENSKEVLSARAII